MWYLLAQLPNEILPDIRNIPKSGDFRDWFAYATGLLVFVIAAALGYLVFTLRAEQKEGKSQAETTDKLWQDRLRDTQAFLAMLQANHDRTMKEHEEDRKVQIVHNEKTVAALQTITLNSDAQYKVIDQKLDEIRENFRRRHSGDVT